MSLVVLYAWSQIELVPAWYPVLPPLPLTTGESICGYRGNGMARTVPVRGSSSEIGMLWLGPFVAGTVCVPVASTTCTTLWAWSLLAVTYELSSGATICGVVSIQRCRPRT